MICLTVCRGPIRGWGPGTFHPWSEWESPQHRRKQRASGQLSTWTRSLQDSKHLQREGERERERDREREREVLVNNMQNMCMVAWEVQERGKNIDQYSSQWHPPRLNSYPTWSHDSATEFDYIRPLVSSRNDTGALHGQPIHTSPSPQLTTLRCTMPT